MDDIERAAQAIREADAMVIGSGAGMGVDSGLPDFRGNQGFWRAYPPLQRLGISFVDMANPRWFARDPALAWGFYGHRLGLYRETSPHEGFDLLLRWSQAMRLGCFVFTSNVDGHFQRADFDPQRVVECHGSIHHLQCAGPCSYAIWSAEQTVIQLDIKTFRAAFPLPSCPDCGGLARPNILMFGDAQWLDTRTRQQEDAFEIWLSAIDGQVVVIELGAGSAVPTVRWTCERLAKRLEAPLVRINPREPHGPPGTLSLTGGALAMLRRVDALLGSS